MSEGALQFARLSSFSTDCLPTESINIVYQDSALNYPKSVKRKVQAVWTDLVEGNDRLFDGPMMSVYDIKREDNCLYTEQTSFRYFQTKRGLLRDFVSATEYGFTDDDMQFLLSRLRILSSFVAVIVDGQLLLGVRGSYNDEPRVSFPGSGYLDPSEDTTSTGEVVEIRDIICREVKEELGLTSGIDEVCCMGVFENYVRGYHFNPALFSIIEVTQSQSDLEAASENATDSWEFDRFVYVPIAREPLHQLLLEKSAVPPVVFGTNRPGKLSSKACLMILLIGARYFGESWFEHVLEDINIIIKNN